ncbi:hypothetical protein [Vreelandella glaciei]|nr:hypothetical protein [Halomonas glaciei]
MWHEQLHRHSLGRRSRVCRLPRCIAHSRPGQSQRSSLSNSLDGRFLIHWMVAWSALLALTIGIRMAAAEPDQPPPSAPQLGTPMTVVTSEGGESEPETD